MTKQIGDTLTDKELNTIQTLLHANQEHTEQITLQNTITTPYGTVNVKYGNEYYKRKSGIITNNLQIKITNPLLPILNYELTLTYKSLNNDLLDNDDNITETVTYNIPINEYVTIAEGTLQHIIYYTLTLTIRPQRTQTHTPNTLTTTPKTIFIENNQTTTITTTLTADTIPIDNEPLTFTQNGTTTTITTNNQGEATLTYTGNKQGKLDYTVTYHTLQETFTIYDSFFHNDTFFNAANRLTITENPDNSITLRSTQTTNAAFYLADQTGTATNLSQCLQFDAPFTMFVEILNYTGTAYIQFYDGTNTKQVKLSKFETTNKPFTVKADVYEDKIEYYVNGEKREDLTWIGTMGTCRAGIRVDPGATVTYKDIYLSDTTGDD